MPLCGTADAPVLDLCWCLLWVFKLELSALFAFGGDIHGVQNSGFTFGVYSCITLYRFLLAT